MTAPIEPGQWIYETHRNAISTGFFVEEVLFSGKSEFQQVDVVQARDHGRILLCDRLFMLSEKDEFVYHEMISHPALHVHPDPRRVLIIGGGDGGTAREVLKHKSIERCVMVEIDRMVVEASRRHIPSVSKSLDDPRLEILYEDGIAFAKNTQESFDVVMVDSTDPIGPAVGLFSEDFYGNIHRILGPQGIFIAQAESVFYELEFQKKMLANLKANFSRVHVYLYSNLTYPGGLWAFSFASKGLHPINGFDPGRVDEASMGFRYYNANVHKGAFGLPCFAAKIIEGLVDPVEL